jgi:hypothetical protein
MGDRMEDIVVVTMSEFGRTAEENGTGGTDHGHGNVMLVLGGNEPPHAFRVAWLVEQRGTTICGTPFICAPESGRAYRRDIPWMNGHVRASSVAAANPFEGNPEQSGLRRKWLMLRDERRGVSLFDKRFQVGYGLRTR